MGVQLRLITPSIKEFLQAIVWFNPEVIESVVQSIPVFFTKEINREMFLLPVAGISKLPVVFQANATEMCVAEWRRRTRSYQKKFSEYRS
jgi:hypothetical protein